VASRALLDPEAIREVLLTRASPEQIGLAGLGGALAPVGPDDDLGLHVLLGPRGERVHAALAPGLLLPLRVERWERIALGAAIELRGPALLALDGERERTLRAGEPARLRLDRAGPLRVDLARCLAQARAAGFFAALR
jgi:hypothetical protein